MMLGEFTDDLTIYVKDVFPMPQLGTEASVETIDEKFQSDYLELMKQTGRQVSIYFIMYYQLEWKMLLDGIIHTLDLVVGYLLLM